jgi:hypothetical protein
MKLAQGLARALRALYLARRASPSKVKRKGRPPIGGRLASIHIEPLTSEDVSLTVSN